MLGTVDAAGNLVSTRKYDVYGAVRASAGPAGPKHKFVGGLGHPSEEETGLIYMRARYYDPVTGRFISEDPAADGDNWFTYAQNSATNLTDPNGRSAQGDLLRLRGNLLIILGMFLLGQASFRHIQLSAGGKFLMFDPTPHHLVGEVLKEFINAVASLYGRGDAFEAGRRLGTALGRLSTYGGGRGAMAMAGYLLILWGCMDYVDAAFEDGK